jgi:hypothetical protein
MISDDETCNHHGQRSGEMQPAGQGVAARDGRQSQQNLDLVREGSVNCGYLEKPLRLLFTGWNSWTG